jgi:hypothetical protein
MSQSKAVRLLNSDIMNHLNTFMGTPEVNTRLLEHKKLNPSFDLETASMSNWGKTKMVGII